MPTLNEYAAIAAYIYNDQRGGGGGQATTNTLPVPQGWVDLVTLGFAAGDNINSWNPFSFTGGAYLNQSTGEIVVAYKGTDFLTGFEGRSWNTVADLVTDVSLAITRKGLGTYNLQQLAASSYFLAVKDWAAQNGYDGNNISFTGHSLGGGLASNMAVWFDRPATTFAEGPFELSACNRIDMAIAIATLTAQAAVSGSAAVLEVVNPLRELMLSIPAVFIRLAHPSKILRRLHDIKWDTGVASGCRRWPQRSFFRRFDHQVGFHRAGCTNRISTVSTSLSRSAS